MIIGIAGTAKNTGKTTALGALIREATSRRLRVAVTGIGYDGEERDTITGLPKPRLDLPPGTIATTSEACLQVSERFVANKMVLIVVNMIQPFFLGGDGLQRTLMTLDAYSKLNAHRFCE